MRISVVGSSGTGKSTLARSIADGLGLPHLELDSIYHQPNWQPLPDDEFARRVGEFVAGDQWVVDGNYRVARPLVWARADDVVWLDLPRLLVFGRLFARTIRRGIKRTELWNGNRESLSTLFNRGEENLLLWSWTQHRKYRTRYAAAMTDPDYARLRFIRIRRTADARPAAVLSQLRSPPDQP